jgi:hypothetical protein
MSHGLELPEAASPAALADPVALPPDEPSDAPAAAPRRGRSRWLWVQVALGVILLGTSAAGRAWQARRVDQMLRDGRVSPVRLASLPKVLGPWVGDDETMDSAIARATGSTDSIFRNYQHRITGQKISLIVLFGPSTEMYVHSPENCYPAAGYAKVEGPKYRAISSAGAAGSWPFFETVFSKGEGGQGEQQEVYCTWRYSEAWTPGLTSPKGFERIPGMFKVQVGRRIRETELHLLHVDNPCESFLAQLMPELDRRIQEGRAKSRPAVAAR